MKKNIRSGFYATTVSVILTVIALAFYLYNTGTAYFANLGVSVPLVVFLAAAIICGIAAIGSGIRRIRILPDLFQAVMPVLLVAGTVLFLGERVNGIGAIMTFQNNEANQADLRSAIIGIVFCAVAVIAGIIASFLDIADTERS